MECGWIVFIGPCCLLKLLGDLPFRITKDDPGLAFTLGLRLHGHRILELGRDDHVAYLHRTDMDTPLLGSGIDDLLKHCIELLPPFQHL